MIFTGLKPGTYTLCMRVLGSTAFTMCKIPLNEYTEMRKHEKVEKVVKSNSQFLDMIVRDSFNSIFQRQPLSPARPVSVTEVNRTVDLMSVIVQM